MFGGFSHYRRFALQVKKNAVNRGFRLGAIVVVVRQSPALKATTAYSDTPEL